MAGIAPPPLPSAPLTAVFLMLFLGFGLLSLAVDETALRWMAAASDSDSDSSSGKDFLAAFYRAKALEPPVWFLAINVLALLGGLFNHGRMAVAVLSSKAAFASAAHRRWMGILAVSFFANLAVTVLLTVPLERRAGGAAGVAAGEWKDVAGRLFQLHAVGALAMCWLLFLNFSVWKAQSAAKPKDE